jgi:DegV family protein with EDD domain
MSKEHHPISVFTDAACDLPSAVVEEYNIGVVPIKLTFGEEDVTVDQSFTLQEFLHKIKASPYHPTTGAETFSTYASMYKETPNDIVSIHLGSGYSAVHDAAVIGAKELPERDITVVDSKSLSLGLGFMAWEAAVMAKDGYSAESIKKHIDEMSERTSVFASMETLDYAVKGGRINKIEHWVGTRLKQKPILKFHDNELDAERIRTRKKSLARMLEIAQTYGPLEKVGVIHSGEGADKHAEILADQISDFFDGQIIFGEITPVIVAHSGPGTVGMILLREKQY